MGDLQWMLELLLVGLLAATLFHALRLERALGVLKRDRASLEALVAGFNGATRQAQRGTDQLREAADGAGRQLARQIDMVAALKEDLTFLIDRGDRLADRMDGLVRAGKADAPPAAPFVAPAAAGSAGVASAGEADALTDAPRARSQAERDLLKALRMAR